jgi:hypothetical protein
MFSGPSIMQNLSNDLALAVPASDDCWSEAEREPVFAQNSSDLVRGELEQRFENFRWIYLRKAKARAAPAQVLAVMRLAKEADAIV